MRKVITIKDDESESIRYYPDTKIICNFDYGYSTEIEARFYQYGCVFNQSVIECLAHGTPIFYKLIYPTKDPTFRNWLQDEIKIKDGYNGFCWDGTNFLDCWERAKNIDQRNCWLTAKEYSVEEMLRTFEEGINFVAKDSKIV